MQPDDEGTTIVNNAVVTGRPAVTCRRSQADWARSVPGTVPGEDKYCEHGCSQCFIDQARPQHRPSPRNSLADGADRRRWLRSSDVRPSSCDKHYRRWKRHGDPGREPYRSTGRSWQISFGDTAYTPDEQGELTMYGRSAKSWSRLARSGAGPDSTPPRRRRATDLHHPALRTARRVPPEDPIRHEEVPPVEASSPSTGSHPKIPDHDPLSPLVQPQASCSSR